MHQWGRDGLLLSVRDIDEAAVNKVRAAGYGYGCAIWPSTLTGRACSSPFPTIRSRTPGRSNSAAAVGWLLVG